MSVHREGIEDVRVSTLPDGIAADGSPAAVSGAALVTWRSSHTGMLHQVYVNGRFAGATLDPGQRRLVVQTPGSFESAARVEVVAVDPKDAHADCTGELAAPPGGRVRLSILRSQALPVGAKVNVYFDSGTGQVDYDHPLNASPIVLWSCPYDKAGFGTAQFGAGDFGYDSAASIGFGRGSFGSGQFGLDADTLDWTSRPLPFGRYRFGVKILDAHGNESAASETEPITVVPPAKPAAGLSIKAYDKQTNQLTLCICDQ
jgi:hypothetical protein